MPIKLTDEDIAIRDSKDADIVKKIMKRQEDIALLRRNLEDVWEADDKQYNNMIDERTYTGDSDVKVPATWDIVETLVSFTLDALFSKGMAVKGKPPEGGDVEKVELYNRALEIKMSKMPNRKNFRTRNDDALRKWRKFGFLAVKVGFDSERMGAQFIPLEPEELYFDFVGTSVHSLDYICHKIKRSEATLLKNKDNYNKGYNITKSVLKSLHAAEPDSSTGKSNTSGVYSHILSGLKLTDSKVKSHIRYFDLYEAHLLWPVGNEYKWHIATILNGKKLIRFEEADYDFPPFLIVPLHEQKGLLVGKSDPRLVRDQQIELNSYRSQGMDAGSVSLQQMYQVDMMADVDPYQLKNRPNGVVFTQTPGGVEPIRRDLSFLSVSQAMQGQLMSDIQILSGATPSLTDALSGSQTAFAEKKNLANSTRRVLHMVRKYVDNVLFPWVELDYKYTRERVEYADFMRMVGKEAAEEGEVALKDFFDEKLDMIAEGFEDITDKLTKIQQELNCLNIATKSPQIINAAECAKDVFEAMGKKNVDKYVFLPPKPTMVAPEDENSMIEQGQKPDPPNPRDNDQIHLRKHAEADFSGDDAEIQKKVEWMDEHTGQHRNNMQMKQGGQAAMPPQEQPHLPDGVPQPAPSGVQESELGGQAMRTPAVF